MKVKDTLEIDLVCATLKDKLFNFIEDRGLFPNTFIATQYVKSNFPKWQFNGAAPFEDIMLWCEEHLGDNWIWNFETIYFKTKEDRAFFALCWG